MRRIIVIIGAIFILALPIGLFIYQNKDRLQEAAQVFYWSNKRSISSQYTSEAKMSGYNVIVADTAFLEYLAATMSIYEDNAIVDPRIYFGEPDNPQRYTVSHLRFELVPLLDRYMVGLGGEDDFAVRGVYVIDGDTLVVQVSLNEEQVAKSNVQGQFALEDMFLDAALQTLSYVRGSTGPYMDVATVNKIQRDIKEYVQTGIFNRPIRIEKTSDTP